jgi:hypothetical protein
MLNTMRVLVSTGIKGKCPKISHFENSKKYAYVKNLPLWSFAIFSKYSPMPTCDTPDFESWDLTGIIFAKTFSTPFFMGTEHFQWFSPHTMLG